MSTIYLHHCKKSSKREFSIETINVWSVNIPVFLEAILMRLTRQAIKVHDSLRIIAEFDKHAIINCGYFLQNKDIKK
jgi:hypothetical protein